jgi:hypothetical protein
MSPGYLIEVPDGSVRSESRRASEHTPSSRPARCVIDGGGLAMCRHEHHSGGAPAAPEKRKVSGIDLADVSADNGPGRARMLAEPATRKKRVTRLGYHGGAVATNVILNAADHCATVSTISAGQRGNGQVADSRDTVYGSGARALSSIASPAWAISLLSSHARD